jgi:hypothetical protein
MTSYQSRNMPFEHSVSWVDPGIVTTLSDVNMAPGQSVTLTIAYAQGSSAVLLGDMVACSFTADSVKSGTFTAPFGATLSSVAQALATSINSCGAGIQAVAVGGVITLTNSGTTAYKVSSNVGTKYAVQEAIQWAIRNCYVSVWSGSLVSKYQIHTVVESTLNRLTGNGGFPLPSTEWIELKLTGVKPDDMETDKDVYTDYFLFNIEHWTDSRIDKWSITALNPSLSHVSSLQ